MVMSKSKKEHGENIKAGYAAKNGVRKEYADELATAEAEFVRKPYRATVGEEVYEAILDDLRHGLTLYQASLANNMSPASCYARSRDDPEFAERLRLARVDSILTNADQMRDIANDEPDVARAALKIKVIGMLGKIHAPEYFQERVQHKVEHSVAPVMLPPMGAFDVVEVEFEEVPRLDDGGDDGE